MKRELGLLNFICIAAAVIFVALAVVNLLTSGDFLTTDNLFITMVCLVMALMFAVNPILYLKSEGRLPAVPFTKKERIQSGQTASQITAKGPALLDAKGRAVPPDVRQIVANLGEGQAKDAQ
jgi:hypothetical protein